MTNKIKIIISWCMAILMILAISPFGGAESLYKSVIRLHVLAESDSEEDQKLKLAVRDEILEYISKDYNETDDISSAKEKIENDIPIITKIAEQKIKSMGYSYPVSVTFGEENYPTRYYGSLSFPSGKYISLKVIIGNGKGQNWWCVLFPPVCTNSAKSPESVMREKGISEDNIKTVTKDGKIYEIKFKILEIISSLAKK